MWETNNLLINGSTYIISHLLATQYINTYRVSSKEKYLLWFKYKKYCLLFLNNLKIIHSVWGKKTNKTHKSTITYILLFYFIYPLQRNHRPNYNFTSSREAKDLRLSNFLVNHNPLPFLPVKDWKLKPWIMRSQEKHFT